MARPGTLSSVSSLDNRWWMEFATRDNYLSCCSWLCFLFQIRFPQCSCVSCPVQWRIKCFVLIIVQRSGHGDQMRSSENDIVIGTDIKSPAVIRDQGPMGGDNGADVRQVEPGQWSPVTAIITPDITHYPRDTGSRPTSFLPPRLLITTESRERFVESDHRVTRDSMSDAER